MTTISKAARVVQEVLRRADASEGNNRWQFKPLSDPPTITGSTTAPSSSVFTRYHSADITGPAPWQVMGGKLLRQPVEGESWGKRIVTGIIELANTDFPADLWTGRTGSIVTQFLGDALVFELEANNDSYQFLIEEDGVDRVMDMDGLGITPVGTSNQSKAYYTLTWSTSKMRKVTLQCNANEVAHPANNRIGRFGGIYTKEHQIITRPRYHGPRIGGMGDSNIQGTNGPSSEGYLAVAFNELGLKDTWISSYGASGAYAGPPGFYDAGIDKTWRNGVKWSQRRQVWEDGNLDVMVFSISWNDWNLQSEANIVALEMAELDACRAMHPEMVILMVGLHTMPVEEMADETSGSGATILGTNAAMKAAIESRDDPYMKYIDTSSLYEAPFQGDGSDDSHSGTGDYDINFTWTGHYSRQGDRRIGRAISARMYDAFRAMHYGVDTVVEEPGTPALSSSSGSQSYDVDETRAQGLAIGVNCVLDSVASVTPALPSGFTLVVGGTPKTLGLGGVSSVAVAEDDYVIVINVVGGGTLTYTLSLEVVEAEEPPTSEYLIDVTFDGESTDTSITDAAGNVWVPVGGATCDGVIPEGGGFECTTPALLAGAVFGTDDFTVETVMSPTNNDVTVIDFGVALGNPMCCAVDNPSNPQIAFYSASAGWKQAATFPSGTPTWKMANAVCSWYRDSGVIKLGFDWMANLSWGGGADTHDYDTAPTKVTIGTRQGDATNRPFAGTITSLKVRKGS